MVTCLGHWWTWGIVAIILKPMESPDNCFMFPFHWDYEDLTAMYSQVILMMLALLSLCGTILSQLLRSILQIRECMSPLTASHILTVFLSF